MIHRHAQKLYYWDSSGMRVGPFDHIGRALDNFISHLNMNTSYDSADLLRKLTDSTITLYGEFRSLEIDVETAKEERDEEFLSLSDRNEILESQNIHLRNFIRDNGLGDSYVPEG